MFRFLNIDVVGIHISKTIYFLITLPFGYDKKDDIHKSIIFRKTWPNPITEIFKKYYSTIMKRYFHFRHLNLAEHPELAKLIKEKVSKEKSRYILEKIQL